MKKILFVAAFVLWPQLAHAEEAPSPPPPGGEAAAAEPGVADYCANYADKAAEARIAWQTQNLQKLQDDITGKLATLDAKQKELQDWIAKRDALLKLAGKELVDIYAKMDPEAAALQMAQLDPPTAVSVLRQLRPQSASIIMSSIEPKRAALLAKMIATAVTDNKDAPASKPAPAKTGGNGT